MSICPKKKEKKKENTSCSPVPLAHFYSPGQDFNTFFTVHPFYAILFCFFVDFFFWTALQLEEKTVSLRVLEGTTERVF